MLLAARDGAELDGLVTVGRCLAGLGRHELLLTQAVGDEASLADAVAATRARRDELATGRVTARAAAFVSRAFGPDMARLALTHDADLMVVERLRGDRTRRIHLARVWRSCSSALRAMSPCSPARRRLAFADGIAVLFAGGEHDWAAAELGAWLAAGASARLQLIGVRGRDGGDASRLLASASIAIQQVVGIDVEPVLADAGPGRPGGSRRLGRCGRRGAVAALAARGPRRVAAHTRWRPPLRRSSSTAARVPAASRRASS